MHASHDVPACKVTKEQALCARLSDRIGEQRQRGMESEQTYWTQVKSTRSDFQLKDSPTGAEPWSRGSLRGKKQKVRLMMSARLKHSNTEVGR